MAVLAAVGLFCCIGLAQGNPGYRYQLSKRDASVVNARPVTVLAVAALPGRHREVDLLTRRLGGRVDYVHAPTDYLAVVLPTEKVDAFLAEAPLAAFAVEDSEPEAAGPPRGSDRPPKEATPSPVRNARPGWPPREGMAPVEHPHAVIEDIDGTAFLGRDPRNDGRGVVIAHVESFPDFLIPEMQSALDADGKTVPKFRDVVNVPGVAPSLEAGARRPGFLWSTPLQSAGETRGGVVEYRGRSHRVPGPGRYRWAELELPAHKARDVRPVLKRIFGQPAVPKDGEANGEGERFLAQLLWSETNRTLWVDTDQDGDFDDETGVGEYSATGDIGVLGEDDPATPLRESIGYAVQVDGDHVSLNLGYGAHATLVAGAMAASKGSAGRIEGVAPGAQLIAINAHEGATGFVRALIVAYEHPASDVVLVEGHTAVTTLREQTLDGRSLIAVVADRLQALHDKPSLFTASNVPGMSTIMDATVAPSVLSIGAYQSADAVYAGYGLHVRYRDDLHWAGSEGPAGDGTLKPDLLSPANPTSVTPWASERPELNKRAGIFHMPGYAICGGTSCATPVASGAAALLVGAAKREGLPASGTAIHRALRDSARMIGRFPVYKQGHGLIQVDAAWRRLQQLAGETPETIEVSAPVRTAMSPWLQRPGTGQGLFEREGWQAGQTGTRTIALTRTSGPAGPLRYRLRWKGDAQAFQSADSVELPLNLPVGLEVWVSVQEAQTYSALLELHRDGLAGPAAVVPATIVVPQRFTERDGYQVEQAFELDRPGRVNLFYDVPEDAGLLRFQWLEGRKGLRGNWHSPDNWQFAGYAPYDEGSHALSRPMAGGWQMTLIDNMDNFEHDWSVPPGQVLPRTKVKVRASLLSAEARIEDRQVVVRNRGAAFDGQLRTRALAVQRSESIALAPVQSVERTFAVAEGTERLVLELLPDAGTDAAWMTLYQCERPGRCLRKSAVETLMGGADVAGRNKRIVLDHPGAGTWKAVITHYGARPGKVELRELQSHPKYGVLTSADTLRTRAVGAEWRVPFQVWRREAPPAGYGPAMLLDVGIQGAGGQPPMSVLLKAVALD